jgi:hypothetical protein
MNDEGIAAPAFIPWSIVWIRQRSRTSRELLRGRRSLLRVSGDTRGFVEDDTDTSGPQVGTQALSRSQESTMRTAQSASGGGSRR